MTENNIPTIIQNLEKELSHRLEKLWRVFSWTSSILVTITAGIIIMERVNKVILEIKDRVIISIVILILSFYAYQWLKENLNFERIVRKQLSDLISQNLNYTNISNIDPIDSKFGYTNAVISLGLVALIATWLNVMN